MKTARLIPIYALAIVVGTSTDVSAGDNPAKPPTAKAGVQRLFGIDWQPSLDAAQKEARRTPSARPIVLFRVLGNLDDKL